jgi:hypothetical protein
MYKRTPRGKQKRAREHQEPGVAMLAGEVAGEDVAVMQDQKVQCQWVVEGGLIHSAGTAGSETSQVM